MVLRIYILFLGKIMLIAAPACLFITEITSLGTLFLSRLSVGSFCLPIELVDLRVVFLNCRCRDVEMEAFSSL